MPVPSFTLRAMTPADLPTCLSFTQQVNWPHRQYDWQLHYTLGKGYVISDADQQLAGCILWWDYGSAYGSIGLVVVPAKYQGQGLGRQLMNSVLAAAGDRSMQLVATVAGEKLYQQCGFRTTGKIYQVQGIPTQQPALQATSGLTFLPLSAETLPAALKLDAAAYNADRSAVITQLATQGSGLVAYRAGRAVAFGIVRDSGRGQTVGPIIAESDNDATQLAIALMQQTQGFIRFDLTAAAVALKTLLLAADLQQVDEVNLMVKGDYLPATGTLPAADSPAKPAIYGLASQAFG